MNWYENEDIKYSKLYSSGYPMGNPFGIVKEFNYKKNMKILDLGCGRANLARHFDDYTGIDVSDYIINLNKKNYPNKKFIKASIHKLEFLKNEKFDVVVCVDVMEHIPETEVIKVLEEISTLNADKVALSISTRKSVFLDTDGNNLHLTVWTPDQWLIEIKKLFIVDKVSTKPSLLNVELTNKVK